jgi:hypothetical protein
MNCLLSLLKRVVPYNPSSTKSLTKFKRHL